MPLVVRLRSAVCCSDASPRSPAPISTSTRARSCSWPGRTARARPRCCACSPGWCRCAPGEAEVYGVDLAGRPAQRPAPSRPRRPRDLLLRRPHRAREPALRGQGRGRDAAEDAEPAHRAARARRGGRPHPPSSRPGQRRRLALGAALVRDPQLLLLDEPHAGLDADGREVLDEIVAAAPAEGRTVLMASHELDLARRPRHPRGPRRLRPHHRPRRPHPAAHRPAEPERPHERLAGGRAGGGQGPADRGAVPGRALPDPAVRADRDPAVRVRARPRPRDPARAAPGLFWIAVLLASLLAIGRAFAIEEQHNARDGLRLSGLDGGCDLPRQGGRDRGRAPGPRGRARRRSGAALRRQRPRGR